MKRFLALFPQRYGSIFRSLQSEKWRSMSQFHYLSDMEILDSVSSDARHFRACLPNQKATYIVCNFSLSNDFSSTEALVTLVNQLRNYGFKPNLYKEAGSDSVQIYISFTETVMTDEVAERFSSLWASFGAVFYGTDRPFVLPLQKGFCWLNDDLSVKLSRDDISFDSAMAIFLHDLESTTVSPQILTEIELKLTQKADVEELIDQREVDFVSDETPLIEPVYAGELVSTEQTESVVKIPCEGGQQLLLFPVDVELMQPELPKERPKRTRRFRSNLPDGSLKTEHLNSTLLSNHIRNAQSVLKFSKEVNND